MLFPGSIVRGNPISYTPFETIEPTIVIVSPLTGETDPVRGKIKSFNQLLLPELQDPERVKLSVL